MTPKRSPGSSPPESKILQLEVKLNRLYRVVNQLQQQVNQISNDTTDPNTSLPQPVTPPSPTSSKFRGIGLGFLLGVGLFSSGFWLISTPYFQSTFADFKTIIFNRKNSTSASIYLPIQPPQEQQQEPLSKQWIYNVKNSPNLSYSNDLQEIVDLVVEQAKAEELPTNNLSIHLIDVKNQTFAEYRSQIPYFPASITKLFWMVAFYSQVHQGKINADAVNYTPECQTDICQLIKKSNNESASRILDQITNTSSVPNEQTEAFETWLEKRHSINQFFQEAEYQDLNISQKNFPIPYLEMENPEHWDQKMRGDEKQPIRNQISAAQAGRLMYEIVTKQAISKSASQQMLKLLEQNLDPQVWQQEESNPIAGFLGEGLVDTEVRFASKVGWTSSTRFEVAAITSKDQQVSYIITIFGHGTPYASNEQIFPTISRLVYENMTATDN